MEEPAKVHLHCNKCLSVINSGQCFRTTLCQHLICETCAMQHFQTDCSCPVCGEMLNEDQLAEIVVGVEVQNVHASTFQAMFASPNWESLAMQTFSTIDLYRDQAGFVLTQLLMLNRQYEQRCRRLEHDLAQAKHEKTQLVSANTGLEQKNKLIEHKLNAKDHELKQISECYKEKARKAAAWEHQYNQLRAKTGGAHTPPLADGGLLRSTSAPQQQITPSRSRPLLGPSTLMPPGGSGGREASPPPLQRAANTFGGRSSGFMRPQMASPGGQQAQRARPNFGGGGTAGAHRPPGASSGFFQPQMPH